MKTTQSRIFLTTAIIFLLALLILGLSLQMLVGSYLTTTTREQLDNHSKELSKLASAYYANDGSMDSSQFFINLNLMAQVSQTDTLILDGSGHPIYYTGQLVDAEAVVPQGQLDQIASKGLTRMSGVLEGFYSEPRYFSARPVKDGQTQQVIGFVLSSVPKADNRVVMQRVSNMFMLGAIAVMVVSVMAMAVFSKRQSSPLKEMAQKARAFGHGDLNARVRITGSESREMEELAIAFNNMASSLQKSEYSRQEFVANVSHELKTPMTTIGGYVDGILDGTIPPEKSRYYMQIVSTETKRLSRLVRSMLDISQLQSTGGIPAEQMTRFDVEECAGQMLITFEQKITDKNIQVDVQMPQCPIYTVAQQDYVSQVIYNLLDNAVKFCPQEGRLLLKIQESDNKIHVTVGNDGQTIPAEELPLLFDRFHKMDKSRAENRDGWGLGLYIVKTIVGLHGEDISATSLDGFTEFTFTLPLMS